MALLAPAHSEIVDSGLVGYAIGERPGSIHQVYACLDHTPEARKRSHNMVFREEAAAADARCQKCAVELAGQPGEAVE